MARNAEKANSMLNRWWAAKLGIHQKPQRRPRLVVKVGSLTECEKWRHQVIKEISKNIAQIQNPTLNESRVRALNDEINKLIREKRSWERHIKSLGGADYERSSSAMMDDGGILGNGGYRYFGAAKNLPGVKELLHDQKKAGGKVRGEAMKGSDGRLMKDVYIACDAQYFGYDDLFNPQADGRAYQAQAAANAARIMDVDKPMAPGRQDVASTNPADIENDERWIGMEPANPDQVRERYLAMERQAERRLRQQKIEKWLENKRKRQAETAEYDVTVNDADDEEDDSAFFGGDGGVVVPSNEDVQAALLERRKELLLRKYISKDVRQSVQTQ